MFGPVAESCVSRSLLLFCSLPPPPRLLNTAQSPVRAHCLPSPFHSIPLPSLTLSLHSTAFPHPFTPFHCLPSPFHPISLPSLALSPHFTAFPCPFTRWFGAGQVGFERALGMSNHITVGEAFLRRARHKTADTHSPPPPESHGFQQNRQAAVRRGHGVPAQHSGFSCCAAGGPNIDCPQH